MIQPPGPGALDTWIHWKSPIFTLDPHLGRLVPDLLNRDVLGEIVQVRASMIAILIPSEVITGMVALSLGIKSGTPNYSGYWIVSGNPCYYLHEGIALVGKINRNPEIQLLSSGETSTLLVVLLSLIPMVMSKSAGWLLGDSHWGRHGCPRPRPKSTPHRLRNFLLVDSPSCRVVTVAYDGGWME